MNENIILKLIQSLSYNIRNHNEELKRGRFSNTIKESDKIINQYFEYLSNISLLVKDDNFGLNLEIKGITGSNLFPSILYQNSFRLQILKELDKRLNDFLSFKDLEFFLSKKLNSTMYIKKGGFNKSTLEILRSYLINFNKILDNELDKYLPYIESYDLKFFNLRRQTLIKKFDLTQKYLSFLRIPKFINFGLNAVLLHHNEGIIHSFTNLPTHPLGLLFNDNHEILFSLFFTPYNRNLKTNTIQKIVFFENLDLFYQDPQLKKLINQSANILELYYDYKDGVFQNTAVSFTTNFHMKKFFSTQSPDLDILIHLFNTRNLPLNHQIHPVSQFFFTYRNKLVNFYSTINYFIYIYQPEGKIIKINTDFIVTLLKNTFANGYVIQTNSAFLISTFLFKQDFENICSSLTEFFLLFNLEVKIFENLNLVPFSFYQLPNSTYFNSESNRWNFPHYQEKKPSELMHYQIDNLTIEKERLKIPNFASRVKNYLENWPSEIISLEQSQTNN